MGIWELAVGGAYGVGGAFCDSLLYVIFMVILSNEGWCEIMVVFATTRERETDAVSDVSLIPSKAELIRTFWQNPPFQTLR